MTGTGGAYERLHEKMLELLAEVDKVSQEINKLEVENLSPEERRRRLKVLPGGRLVAVPVAVCGWMFRETRAHATATAFAVGATVVGGVTTLAAVTGPTEPAEAESQWPSVSRPYDSQTPGSAPSDPPALLSLAMPPPVSPPGLAEAPTWVQEMVEGLREPPIDQDVPPVDEDGNPLPIPEPTVPPVEPPLDDGRPPGTVPTLPPVETEPIVVVPPPVVDDGRPPEIVPPFVEPPELPPILEEPPPVEEEEPPPPVEEELPPVEGDGRGEEEAGDGRG